MLHRIISSLATIDYLSVTLLSVSLVTIGTLTGILAGLSTIIYNFIRIRKDLKSK